MCRPLHVSLFFVVQFGICSSQYLRLSGFKFFPVFLSKGIKHKIHLSLSAKSGFHCLPEFAEDRILITGK